MHDPAIFGIGLFILALGVVLFIGACFLEPPSLLSTEPSPIAALVAACGGTFFFGLIAIGWGLGWGMS